MEKYLHDVIDEILLRFRRPMTVREITDIIQRERLWVRPKDGKYPPANQVSARIKNHPKLFERNNSLIASKVHK